MTQTIGSVGFIGLGSMGGGQARELAKLALPLTVFDKFPAAMEPFRGKATLATSIADLGQCDVVGICVQDDKQVIECCDELIPALQRGAVILVHSTIRPATARMLAERAAAVGVELMDAAVTRTETHNDGPFVFCMLGGDEATMARVQPVLDAYSTNTMLVGPLGSAMGLKICNNLVAWSQIVLGYEAMDLAEAAGVPLDKLIAVMQRNGVMTPTMNGFIAFRNNPGDQKQRSMMEVQAGIGEKDLSLADEMGQAVGKPSAIGTHIKAYVKQAVIDVCRR